MKIIMNNKSKKNKNNLNHKNKKLNRNKIKKQIKWIPLNNKKKIKKKLIQKKNKIKIFKDNNNTQLITFSKNLIECLMKWHHLEINFLILSIPDFKDNNNNKKNYKKNQHNNKNNNQKNNKNQKIWNKNNKNKIMIMFIQKLIQEFIIVLLIKMVKQNQKEKSLKK